jgi:hypothetical protein
MGAALLGALLLAAGLLPASRRASPAPDKPEPGVGWWAVAPDGTVERLHPGP